MKARIKFYKTGSMKFVGHLDIMRFFQRAFRCAKIPVSYSKGFSPHQILSFTSPLGVGLTSDAEYMDMELDECPEPKRMVDWMNTRMTEEIGVKAFLLLPEEAKPSMAMLAACDYMITVKPGVSSRLLEEDWCRERLSEFLALDKIPILKKTKRSEKEVDIRPYLYRLAANRTDFETMTGQSYGSLHLDLNQYRSVLFAQLTSGSVINIKPELVLEAFCQQIGETYDPLHYQIHRLEMYGDAGGKKGAVRLLSDDSPCQLVPLSEYTGEN